MGRISLIVIHYICRPRSIRSLMGSFRSVVTQRQARLGLVAVGLLLLADGRIWACTTGHPTFPTTHVFPRESGSSVSPRDSIDVLFHQQENVPCDVCPDRPLVPGHAPCQGPSCSGNKAPQGVVPTTTFEFRDSTSMINASLVEGTDFPPRGWVEITSLAHPIEIGDAVFHPPRLDS